MTKKKSLSKSGAKTSSEIFTPDTEDEAQARWQTAYVITSLIEAVLPGVNSAFAMDAITEMLATSDMEDDTIYRYWQMIRATAYAPKSRTVN